jgi:hypothetical protein
MKQRSTVGYIGWIEGELNLLYLEEVAGKPDATTRIPNVAEASPSKESS